MFSRLFRKKPIDQLIRQTDGPADQGLRRVLSVRDLTFLGIAAVVGAGVFSTIGAAAYHGGPGISILFVITALTCGFCALCYAEFASRVPISGSAYTYAYVSFGELAAWIIGWALILEYAIGNIVVAISWSQYFNNLLEVAGIHLPAWMTTDPGTAYQAYEESTVLAAAGGAGLTEAHRFAIEAWELAPVLFGRKIFVNLPAFLIVALITWLTYVGIRESKRGTNLMVIFKVAVILFVVILGAFSLDPGNWSPFMPNGMEGVLKGVSAVFYAYIGFDAISTTAEECRNPRRDLPRAMIYSLLICTGLYILVALTLTGMVHYSRLNVEDPLAAVFEMTGQSWISTIVSVSAVVATTSVLLVFQIGQPRIWMSMSRDGLMPPAFSRIHPRYRTPSFATIITGLVVGIPSLFMPSELMVDLTSIGTLFAFILVCGGVLLLPRRSGEGSPGFRLPYINGRWPVALGYLVFLRIFSGRIGEALGSGGSASLEDILFLTYTFGAALMAAFTFIRRLSMIPVMGVLFCGYLLIEIPTTSWIWFMVWLLTGLLIYAAYGYRKSRLASQDASLDGAP